MKKLAFVLISVLVMTSTQANCRMNPPQGDRLPEILYVEGGETYVNVTVYLAKNVKYPEGADSFGLIGTTVVEFTVSTSGTLSDFNVLNSISSDVDDEVIAALEKTSGSWRPGTRNGQPASMKREASVIFVPNKNYNLESIAKKQQEKADEKLLDDNDPKRAEKLYDRAISMCPYDQEILANRGFARYEAGDVAGAREDWERVAYLNSYDPGSYRYSASNVDSRLMSLTGYNVMKQIVD